MMTRKQWRDQVIEEALEPDLPIIDAHHHIWLTPPLEPWEAYRADAVMADMEGCGHNIVATVYTDSHAHYRPSGPESMRVVGETEYADSVADAAQARGGAVAGLCAAIVTHADLLLGASVGDVLDAHIAASERFRGIRYMTAIDPDLPPIYGATESEIMNRPIFREGFAQLVKRGLSLDTWMFQPQLPEVIELARAFPDANIILDHGGGPLGIGRFAGRRTEAFAQWKRDMAVLSECSNVSVKLGALNMTQTGMDATDEPQPRSSEDTALNQRDHILTAIDLFGPNRCMFESNFPVDMHAISYTLLWNTFKRVTADLSIHDRRALFAGTAARVYRMENVDALAN